KPLGNDRFRGEFCVAKLGGYRYTVEGWMDHFQTWRKDLEKRISAGQDISIDLLIGVELIEGAAARAKGDDAEGLLEWARRVRESAKDASQAALALDADLLTLVQQYPDRRLARRCDRELSVVVDRQKAGFSAWYEVFPRSCSADTKRHGTF